MQDLWHFLPLETEFLPLYWWVVQQCESLHPMKQGQMWCDEDSKWTCLVEFDLWCSYYLHTEPRPSEHTLDYPASIQPVMHSIEKEKKKDLKWLSLGLICHIAIADWDTTFLSSSYLQFNANGFTICYHYSVSLQSVNHLLFLSPRWAEASVSGSVPS